MSDIYTGQETKTNLYLCPECGSPSVEETTKAVLFGPNTNRAKCLACGWLGESKDLVAAPFSHEMGNDEEVLKALMGDMRLVMAKYCAMPLGAALLKWGFLEQVEVKGGKVLNPRQMSRYMSAASRAILSAVIEERQKMEKERADGS